jgi:hypothetical protein
MGTTAAFHEILNMGFLQVCPVHTTECSYFVLTGCGLDIHTPRCFPHFAKNQSACGNLLTCQGAGGVME